MRSFSSTSPCKRIVPPRKASCKDEKKAKKQAKKEAKAAAKAEKIAAKAAAKAEKEAAKRSNCHLEKLTGMQRGAQWQPTAASSISKSVISCQECGAVNNSGTAYCSSCGAFL